MTLTLAQVRSRAERGKPLAWYRPGRRVRVSDLMQSGYSYTLTARPGRDFDPDFRPRYSPGEMLQLGVFSGKYLNDCTGELPREWYLAALRAGKLHPERADPSSNLFGIKSRKSLQYWRRKGWILDPDVRGWFQWYCRYWLGRRVPDLDQTQIARWRSFRRHAGQVQASVARGEAGSRRPDRAQKRQHRPRQRQALLQWAYDPWI